MVYQMVSAVLTDFDFWKPIITSSWLSALVEGDKHTGDNQQVLNFCNNFNFSYFTCLWFQNIIIILGYYTASSISHVSVRQQKSIQVFFAYLYLLTFRDLSHNSLSVSLAY